MSKVQIKSFDNIDDQLKWVFDNQRELSAQRKSITKEADSFSFMSFTVNDKGERMKAEDIPNDIDKIRVKVVINTTGLFDSHSDVHIQGIWKKSLQENKLFYLVNQHVFNFNGILSDEVKAYTEMISWSELGYKKFEGETQALIFEAVLDKNSDWIKNSPDNLKVFNLYKSGKVKNHSIGMRYVKEFTCINSDAYPQQKENWDKYFPYVANKEECESRGFFWAVTEAKIIEGSAVVRGSNYATPTQSVEEIKEENKEAGSSTSEINKNEPSKDTQSEQTKQVINYSNVL